MPCPAKKAPSKTKSQTRTSNQKGSERAKRSVKSDPGRDRSPGRQQSKGTVTSRGNATKKVTGKSSGTGTTSQRSRTSQNSSSQTTSTSSKTKPKPTSKKKPVSRIRRFLRSLTPTHSRFKRTAQAAGDKEDLSKQHRELASKNPEKFIEEVSMPLLETSLQSVKSVNQESEARQQVDRRIARWGKKHKLPIWAQDHLKELWHKDLDRRRQLVKMTDKDPTLHKIYETRQRRKTPPARSTKSTKTSTNSDSSNRSQRSVRSERGGQTRSVTPKQSASKRSSGLSTSSQRSTRDPDSPKSITCRDDSEESLRSQSHSAGSESAVRVPLPSQSNEDTVNVADPMDVIAEILREDEEASARERRGGRRADLASVRESGSNVQEQVVWDAWAPISVLVGHNKYFTKDTVQENTLMSTALMTPAPNDKQDSTTRKAADVRFARSGDIFEYDATHRPKSVKR